MIGSIVPVTLPSWFYCLGQMVLLKSQLSQYNGCLDDGSIDGSIVSGDGSIISLMVLLMVLLSSLSPIVNVARPIVLSCHGLI